MPSLASRHSIRTVVRPAAVLGLVLFTASVALPAVAAKVYRCGNAFQDQPCPEVKIAVATPVERTPTIARDNPCATRDANRRADCAPKVVQPRDALTEIRR